MRRICHEEGAVASPSRDADGPCASRQRELLQAGGAATDRTRNVEGHVQAPAVGGGDERRVEGGLDRLDAQPLEAANQGGRRAKGTFEDERVGCLGEAFDG